MQYHLDKYLVEPKVLLDDVNYNRKLLEVILKLENDEVQTMN